jgi:hypothetical protein
MLSLSLLQKPTKVIRDISTHHLCLNHLPQWLLQLVRKQCRLTRVTKCRSIQCTLTIGLLSVILGIPVAVSSIHQVHTNSLSLVNMSSTLDIHTMVSILRNQDKVAMDLLPHEDHTPLLAVLDTHHLRSSNRRKNVLNMALVVLIP